MTSIQIPGSVAAALPTLFVYDVTNEVSREVAGSGVVDGIAYLTAKAPSSLVRVSERESGFFCDIEDLLTRLIPLETAERERLLLMLLGPRTEAIPFSAGRLSLGRWQRVLLFGFNADPSAEFTLTVLG